MSYIQNAYANFLRSRIKLRKDFIINYTNLFPELIVDEDLSYLKSISEYDSKLEELELMLKRATEIEESISKILKKYSIENTNLI